MGVDLRYLRPVKEFRGAPPEDVAEVAAASRYIELAAGEVVLEQGEITRDAFLGLSGTWAVERTINGRTFTLEVFEIVDAEIHNTIEALTSCLAGSPQVITARVKTDARGIAVPGTALRTFFDRNPDCLWRYVQRQAWYVDGFTTLAADLLARDAKRRVARALMRPTPGIPYAARPWNARDGFVELLATQAQLAETLGTTRQTVSEALTDFERRGWIYSAGRGAFAIADRPALERFANS